MRYGYLLLTACLLSVATAHAQQPVEGATYMLPKTALRLSMLIERKTFTPGELAHYSERYLKTKVEAEEEIRYHIRDIQLTSFGVPDSSKQFTALMDAKHTITKLDLDDNGVLIAVNAEGKRQTAPTLFSPATKAAPLNPRNFMSEDILTAGSKAKMAELCAREIYDIRDSRNQLTRGEAEFMPKDGGEMGIMLQQMDTQEKALRQLFEGTTVTDTVEHIITFIPERETESTLLFRFSERLGLVDNDDLGGRPYTISIEDLHVLPSLQLSIDNNKKSKDDVGIYVNRPGKARITLSAGDKNLGVFEMYIAQFGTTEALSGELFSKKQTTHVILNPVTGNAETLQLEAIRK